jgi:hypothetical protein
MVSYAWQFASDFVEAGELRLDQVAEIAHAGHRRVVAQAVGEHEDDFVHQAPQTKTVRRSRPRTVFSKVGA